MASTHGKDLAMRQNKDEWQAHTFSNHEEGDTQLNFTSARIGNRNLILPDKDMVVKNKTHRITYIEPDTSISGASLVSGSRCEFDIAPDMFNVRGMYLILSISNSSNDTAQILPPAHLLIDSVRLLGNGQKELQRLDGHDLFLCSGTFKTIAQMFSEQGLTNLTPAYTATGNIPALGSVRYWIPLHDLLPPDRKDGFPLFNIRKLKVEVRFRGSDAIIQDSSAGDGLPIVLTQLQLLLETTHYPKSEVVALDNIHSNGISYRYPYFNEQKFDQQLVASTTYNFKCNSIRGLSPWMWICLFPQGGTGQDLFNPPAIGEWIFQLEIRDDNNMSLTNSHKYYGEYIKHIIPADKLDNGLAESLPNTYWISFGEDPYVAYREGLALGYEYLDDANFQITTSSTLATANYTVRFIVPTYALLHILSSGQITYER